MTRTRILTAAALLLLAAGVVLWFVPRHPGESAQVAALQIGGPFVLPSSKGGTVDSALLRGKPYAVFFGFTHCPEVCPTTLYEMSASLAEFGETAKDMRVFFITVDPARDTVAVMRDYIASFDPRIEALVPDEDQLQRLASDFRVYFAKVPVSGGYTMDHTATIFLFNRDGAFSGTIGYGEAPDMRRAKLGRLFSP